MDGSGSGGPNSGTSWRQVTDTCVVRDTLVIRNYKSFPVSCSQSLDSETRKSTGRAEANLPPPVTMANCYEPMSRSRTTYLVPAVLRSRIKRLDDDVRVEEV